MCRCDVVYIHGQNQFCGRVFFICCLVSVLLYCCLSFFVSVFEKLYWYIHNAVLCVEYPVSFLTEFHEVECRDGIGLGCGV